MMYIIASRQYRGCWIHFIQVTSSNYIKAYVKIFENCVSLKQMKILKKLRLLTV